MEQKSQVFLRFRINNKTPIFEESKFAYIHGHDATGDVQINFSFKSDTDGTIPQEDYPYVPQMMSFRKFRPTQDTGLRCMTIEEMKNEMSLSYRKGEFGIDKIVTSASYRYPKCTQCSRETSKQESIWVCDSGHYSVTPVYALRLEAIVLDQSGNYTRVSFLDEMGKKLLGEDAETILLSEDQEQITKALNQLEGKLFYLGIKQSLKNGKQSGWIVYEIASLNEELAE